MLSYISWLVLSVPTAFKRAPSHIHVTELLLLLNTHAWFWLLQYNTLVPESNHSAHLLTVQIQVQMLSKVACLMQEEEEREREMKQLEVARYQQEMKMAQKEAEEEKIRRKQAYLK